jgi:hypothetical protein
MTSKTNTMKMVILQKAFYRFKVIPIKIMSFLTEMENKQS